jgi:hypothetical protein
MNMVPHQAIGPDLYRISAGTVAEPAEVTPEVVLFLKNGLPIVPPLGHLMRESDEG